MASDTAMAAIRALVAAMPRAAAVLDNDGAVVAENARYRIRLAQHEAGAHAISREERLR